MESFNRIGCTWAGGDYALCTELLRNEWGFEGNVEKWENYYRELEESQKGAEYLKVSKGVEKYIRVFKSRVEKFNNKNKISC